MTATEKGMAWKKRADSVQNCGEKGKDVAIKEEKVRVG